MSWFSDLVDKTGINFNPGDSPVWANTSADPTKGTFGKEATQAAGFGAGGGIGGFTGASLAPLVGIDPITGALIGSAIGHKVGYDNANTVAKMPFGSNSPVNKTSTAPAANSINQGPSVNTSSNNSSARALEERLRSDKRLERPKNIEKTFNLEGSLNNTFGQSSNKRGI